MEDHELYRQYLRECDELEETERYRRAYGHPVRTKTWRGRLSAMKRRLLKAGYRMSCDDIIDDTGYAWD
jgi:hypothetical protein